MKAYLFILFWLCWVFISVRGLSLVAASGGHSSSRCTGLSLSRPLLLQSTSSRHAGSVVVTHRPSCSTAFGIFPDQGLNPCPLHWQADSQPLGHQGSPANFLIHLAVLIYYGFTVSKLTSSPHVLSTVLTITAKAWGLPLWKAGPQHSSGARRRVPTPWPRQF